MNIMGLQKLTLLDFPGKMACTVFTGGCNFRCPFCHNAALVIGPEYVPLMTEDEFFAFLNKRFGVLDGVCITGGEPTLQPDLEDFIRKIKAIGYSVKLDTNGFLPDKLIDLVNKKLVDYVAMDIKSSPSGYGRATGIRNFNIAPIQRSINFLMSGAVDFEFRTTVVRELHSENDIQDIGDWIKGDHKYYLQGFEDSGNLINDGLHGYSENEMKSLLNLLKNRIPNAEIRGL
ncbi:MAG: anaerobic ribonucleoside-triphosphate reductase activating protein [Clostridia bacterium]|nr:anaerobic ribonucleoside-triphosphate reductase activating protein [Clostridia bacterium]